MNKTLINDWWMSTDTLMGSTNTSNVTSEMIHNATKVMSYFRNDGWTDNAIAGMMGNMHLESTFSPALIQATNRWRLPNSAASLSDVPNSVMIDFYKEHYNGVVEYQRHESTTQHSQGESAKVHKRQSLHKVEQYRVENHHNDNVAVEVDTKSLD